MAEKFGERKKNIIVSATTLTFHRAMMFVCVAKLWCCEARRTFPKSDQEIQKTPDHGGGQAFVFILRGL